MGKEDQCNTGLGLGLGIGGGDLFPSSRSRSRKPPVQFHLLFPPWMKEEEKETSPSMEEEQTERLRLKNPDHDEVSDNNCGTRKKLRLTKEQSALLEDSFTAHSTLTQAQKQELAERLNLRPRQVEVWFQNRRARTKLKQTEVDCEFLKKHCESLSDENQRLKRELQELRSLKPAGLPLYAQLSKATTLRKCPSCERSAADDVKISGPIASSESTQVLRLCR